MEKFPRFKKHEMRFSNGLDATYKDCDCPECIEKQNNDKKDFWLLRLFRFIFKF
jgi:hypothetical protein